MKCFFFAELLLISNIHNPKTVLALICHATSTNFITNYHLLSLMKFVTYNLSSFLICSKIKQFIQLVGKALLVPFSTF